MRAEVQIKLNSKPFSIFCVLIMALSLSACPDPSGEYDAFNDRREATLEARETNMGGVEETMGGMDEAGEMMGGMEELQPIPQITTGTFLFGLAANLNIEKPMTFVAEVQIDVNADGSVGQIISMNLDPRTCEDFNMSAGEPVVFMPDEPITIDEMSYFSAPLGRQIVAGTANCISGSLIEAEIQLDGRVYSENALCGEMNGMLYRPYPADLGYSDLTMERSTFAAIRIQGDEDINALEVPKNCEDLDADQSSTAEE